MRDVLLSEQASKRDGLAEDRRRLRQRQRGGGVELPLLGRQHLVHAVPQLVGQRHDIATITGEVQQHVGMLARDGGMREGAPLLAWRRRGVDVAAEEAADDVGHLG